MFRISYLLCHGILEIAFAAMIVSVSGGAIAAAQLKIRDATPNASLTRVVITGQNFDATTPTVRLGNQPLTLVPPATTERIEAMLPAAIAAGTYRLSVSIGDAATQRDSIRLTLGPTGSQRPMRLGGPLRARGGGLTVVSTTDQRSVGPYMVETNGDFISWVAVAYLNYAVRLPLSQWSDDGPLGVVATPEEMGLMRGFLIAQYASFDCTGIPLAASLTGTNGGSAHIPGLRTVLVAPVVGTRTVQYYDAGSVTMGASFQDTNSQASYDYQLGMFTCVATPNSAQQMMGLGGVLFDSTNLPTEPYRLR